MEREWKLDVEMKLAERNPVVKSEEVYFGKRGKSKD